MVNIGNDWDDLLKEEWEKDYYIKLREKLINEYRNYTIYPSMYDIFNALKKTSFNDTKVVILGQDPYHGKGQAHGFSFSVKLGVPTPPSLQNIFKELNSELNLYIPNNGNLEKWADEGVLLLNNVLTVREREPNSHFNLGWQFLTLKIIRLLSEKDAPVVFMLWGNNAKEKKSIIDKRKNLILEAAHPSPFSAYRGFFGCNHFRLCNEYLRDNGLKEIDWQIVNR
ncbi:uracil-DNA glycosylase [Citroniella saccharovorans]|uniref:Uracil-DNA glycosylase n=1 Tax=Citroniella saccharovorans TaxID=2053367 RepID=A0AAW9MUH0_9FIRM|nr:uracil-DNA glycosylase [Citroniella saccharovorans]MEB3429498.1 uracil-DNA glycosylase [Citroniella saccharovorans]